MSELIQITKRFWWLVVAILVALLVLAIILGFWIQGIAQRQAAEAAGIPADRVEIDGLDVHLVGFESPEEMERTMAAVEGLDSVEGVTGELSEDLAASVAEPTTTTQASTTTTRASTTTTQASTTTTQASTTTTEPEGESTTTAAELKDTLNELFELEPINFKYFSSELSSGSKATLDQAAEILKASPDAGRLKVVGHTDSLGPAEPNQRLSERRARAVVSYLVEHGGVDPDRLEYEGRGEAELKVDPQVSYQDGLANRRIEWELL